MHGCLSPGRLHKLRHGDDRCKQAVPMATKIRGSLKEPNCITSSPLTHPEIKPANALAGYLKPFVGHFNCWSFLLRVLIRLTKPAFCLTGPIQ